MDLWKKESKHADALYVDLIPDYNGPTSMDLTGFAFLRMMSKKGDLKSAEFRATGNQQFQKRNWREAMNSYNQSLRFATVDSENISLAYANRSACFFYMEKYEKCLVDIDLARRANYPQRLMPKINARETECRKFLEKQTPIEVFAKPKLSFGSDKMFPCMANVLQIQSNDKFGKHIVAKADIEAGQIVTVEESFVINAQSIVEISCDTCLHMGTNFIPCPNCSDVMFCNVQCFKSNDLHGISCGTAYRKMKNTKHIIEPLLKAVSAFPNIDDLMEFVKRATANRDFSTLEGLSGAQSKYGSFLKLLGKSNQTDISNVRKSFGIILDIPKMKSYFGSLKKRRFLMHLILQHIRIIETNSFYRTLGENIGDCTIANLGIVSSLFNHSCYYNTGNEMCGNEIICYTVRPVKKGEQLFIRYKHEEFPTTEERRMWMRERLQFDCKCSMCEPRFKKKDCLKMQQDPTFSLLSSQQTTDELNQGKHSPYLEAKCRKFMNKYGHLPWCPEIDLAESVFDDIMRQALYKATNLHEFLLSKS